MWRWCRWVVLAIMVAGGAGVLYCQNRLDEQIRRAVESRIAAHYPDLVVSVRAAEWVRGEGIEVRGLLISEPGASGTDSQLAYLEEVFLYCQIDWRQLVQGDLTISRFAIRRPKIRMARRGDGSWSAASLLPLPKLSDHTPRGTIEDGVFEIVDPSVKPARVLTLREINLRFGPADASAPVIDGRRALRIQGAVAGDHLQRIQLDSIFHPSGTMFDAKGQVEGFDVSTELIRSLPAEAAECLGQVTSLRGQVKGSFWVRREPSAGPGLSWQVDGQLSRGRIEDTRLPYPLTDLQGVFRCSPQGVSIQELSARSGPTTLRLALETRGYGKLVPLKLKAESHRMRIDRELFGVLPDSWQKEWYKFMPEGVVDVELLELDYDGRAWRPHLVVRCLDVGFSYHKFPYRLEHGLGKLELKDDVLAIDLDAYSGGEQVRLDATIRNPGPDARVELEVDCDALPLDDKLLDALGDGPRQAVRSLNPKGMASVYFHFWHDDQEAGPRKYLSMTLNRCELRYADFPYPLDNVRGSITMEDGHWSFKQLEGRNDTGLIKCSGRLTPLAQGHELTLNFEGTHIPLDEELRDALSPSAARLWHDIKPRGAVNLAATVNLQPGDLKPRVWIQARPLGGLEDPTASIEPSYFPYRLEKLEGKFTYEDGHVKLQALRAEHGATRVTADGTCQLDAEGGWRLALETFRVDRLQADRELVQALSGRLKKAVMDLRPRGGPMHLEGRIELASGGAHGSPVTALWDLDLVFQQCDLDCGIELEHLNGRVSLAGHFDGQHFEAYGGLDIASVIYNGFQFTQVLGPIWLDDERLLMGLWADRERGLKPQRHLTAHLYGGRLVADLWVEMSPTPRYALQATLAEADLGRWARESAAGAQQLRGQVWANIELRGKGRGVHNLGGHGTLELRNADLYELPLMLALLKTLSGRPPDTTAFHTSDVDFIIDGEHVYLKQIDCNGDAISLRGKGEMKLDRSIDMTFYTVVGRGPRIPLIDMLGVIASQQIMLIHVDGTLDDPRTRREVLPLVAQTLQQLQPPVASEGPGRTAPAPAPSRGFSGARR